ncbi:hypothetical protein OG369_20970 [Streptomyces sp. NBC_01221]|uniref:hypothetical protein n=1 Tax=Streptomyces sp. NBC_01221 TaxID=2903782 RepID=UPI0022502515|nr:hypothetical protein [Streptomyces sp. NBC_01221]MCX4788551.1 hypothetical protein [Streptomyces sp. NBC_01221]
MPSFDSSRGRFRLADRHIAVFAHLLDKETPPAELFHSLRELQQTGLVGPEGELSPLLRDLLTAVANPLVLIQAEVTGQHGPLTHGVVVGQDAVFSHDGWPGEEESEYVPIEPSTLVWELARKVKLQRVEIEESELLDVSEIKTTMGALDATFAALEQASDDVDATRTAALHALSGASDLTEPELSTLVELTIALNSTWRITTAWDGKPGTASVRSIAVWDCGRHGYWERVQPQEPIREGEIGPDSALQVVRTSAGELWDKIADLLPDKEDLVGDNA